MYQKSVKRLCCFHELSKAPYQSARIRITHSKKTHMRTRVLILNNIYRRI